MTRLRVTSPSSSAATDIDPAPASLSIVRPGEEIRIVLEEGEVVRSDGCSRDDGSVCTGIAYVHTLGCPKKTIAEIPFSVGPVTTWKAELAPGTYELDVGANFSAPGRGGDFTGVPKRPDCPHD